MADTEAKTVMEDVRYTFTRSEVYELGLLLGRQVAGIMALQTAKRETAKTFGAQIEHAENCAAATAEKLNAGFEMREVSCIIKLDEPKAGVKSIIRTDTQETVRTEKMTAEEMQRPLPFAKPDEPKPN